MLSVLKKKKTIVTHNGSYHADDIFAVATLRLALESKYQLQIIRTRDPEKISKADYVVDVGSVYDPDLNRFDHHQRGGAGQHANKVPYASFGLVWKHFAHEICDSRVANVIENNLVIPIDARDNGVNVNVNGGQDIPDFTVGREMIYALRASADGKGFEHAIDIAKIIIKSEIDLVVKELEEEKEVEQEIRRQGEPEILILNKHLFWDRIATNFKKIKMVVYPKLESDNWGVETPRDNLHDYRTNRLLFPEVWRGLREAELEKVTETSDVIFCHRGGFLAITKTKEAAIALAQKALEG